MKAFFTNNNEKTLKRNLKKKLNTLLSPIYLFRYIRDIRDKIAIKSV